MEGNSLMNKEVERLKEHLEHRLEAINNDLDKYNYEYMKPSEEVNIILDTLQKIKELENDN